MLAAGVHLEDDAQLTKTLALSAADDDVDAEAHGKGPARRRVLCDHESLLQLRPRPLHAADAAVVGDDQALGSREQLALYVRNGASDRRQDWVESGGDFPVLVDRHAAVAGAGAGAAPAGEAGLGGGARGQGDGRAVGELGGAGAAAVDPGRRA